MPTIYEAIKNDHDEHRTLLATISDGTKDVADRPIIWQHAACITAYAPHNETNQMSHSLS